MDISETAPRVLRAALFTALVVTLSAASHVLLSQAGLPPSTVAAVAAAVFAVAFALAGQERGFGRIAALLVPLELAADTVFTTGQQVCYGPAGGPVAGPLHSVGLDVLCHGRPVALPLARVGGGEESAAAAALAQAGPAASWLLLAAHVLVGLLATAWLRRGERALAGLLGAAVAAGFRPLLLAVAAAGAPAPLVRRAPRAAFRLRRGPGRHLTHSVGRRGPPRRAVAAAA